MAASFPPVCSSVLVVAVVVVVLGVLAILAVLGVLGVLVLLVLGILAVGRGGGGCRRRLGLVIQAVVEADHDLGQALLAGLVQLPVLQQQLHRPREEIGRASRKERGCKSV